LAPNPRFAFIWKEPRFLTLTGYVDNKNTTNKITMNKTLDERNPPPFTVSCAPSGNEGPLFTFKQKKEKQDKKQSNLSHVQIKLPVGCQIFRRIRRFKKYIPFGVAEWMSQWKAV
jgi:hypothetical protein